MKNTHKLLLAGIASCSMFGVISCSTTNTATVKPLAADAKVETVTLALTGLTWGGACPPRVQSALVNLEGVSTAKATMDSATVVVDRNKVSNTQLIAAVKAAGSGYNATVVK